MTFQVAMYFKYEGTSLKGKKGKLTYRNL